MINGTDAAVEDVELLRDGSWRVVKEEVMDLSDDDNDVHVDSLSSKAAKKVTTSATPASVPDTTTSTATKVSVTQPTKLKQPSSTSNVLVQNSNECEVITLSDSDDDNSDSAPVLQPIIATTSAEIDSSIANNNPNRNVSSANTNDRAANGRQQKTNNKTKTSKSTCDIRRYICVYKRKD